MPEPPVPEESPDAAFLKYVPVMKDKLPPVWDWPASDDGRAAFFAAHFGEIVRWVPELEEWRIWHGHRWHPDTTGRMPHYCQLLSRHQHAEAKDHLRRLTDELAAGIEERAEEGSRPKLRKQADVDKLYNFALRSALALGDERTISSTLAALSHQRELVVPIAAWDALPNIVGTRNGALNLITGEHTPGQPSAHITKALDVKHDPGAQCPEWQKFIAEILPDTLADYVQKLAGYSLTGRTDDQAFYFCYGTGKNGKSIFLNTLAGLFGDYAGKAPPELLEEPKNGAPPKANIAQLPGVRFLHGDETSEGARMRENLIKGLTGGDQLTGEHKYCAPFKFTPTAKLWMVGNHRPRVYGTDNGIWRRVREIPFTITISDEKEIPESVLMARFRAERPGILNWMVEGLKALQSAGPIPMPHIVRVATQDYKDSEDDLAEFITECTQDAEEAHREPKADVYQAYQNWAKRNGITFAMTANQFTRRISERAEWALDGGKRHWRAKSVKAEARA